MVVEKILYTDNLRNGTDKINAAIDLSNASKDESASAKTTADDAVIIADNAVVIANTADGKSDSTQAQLDNIVINSGTSDAETIQARDTFPLLKDRLNNTDQQLADKAEQADLLLKADTAYVDTLVASVASASPKPYPTLTAIQTAFPTGDTNNYLNVADGNWYYWNGTAWTVGGLYQSTQWLNVTTTQNATWSVV